MKGEKLFFFVFFLLFFLKSCFLFLCSGWWNNSRPDWKRNTMIAGGVIAGLVGIMFKVSADNERRYRTPDRPIPSQRWAKHTLEDDPDYYEKREAYHRNKKPFWERVLPDSGSHH
jgi:hypothetical protein